MARTGKVAVSITADPSGLERGLRKAEGDVDKFSTRSSGHFARAAKAAAGFAAGLGAIAAAKDAVETTEALGHSTLALHRNLGLSIKTASEWSAVAKARGVESKQLAQAFGTLSKQVAAQSDAFKTLGVSQKTLEGGNFQKILSETADGLERMGPGAERTALSMKLFGRGWQTVVPLLRSGSKEMNANLSLAEKYGATFGDKGAKGIEEFIKQQREAKLASLGLKVAFGTQLAPILTKVIEKFTNFAKQMRDGTGAGGEFVTTLKNIWGAVKPVVKFFTDHPKFIAIAIGAWAAYKTAAVAAAAKTRLAVLGVFKPAPITAAAAEAGAVSGAAFTSKMGRLIRGFGWAGLGLAAADAFIPGFSKQLDQAFHPKEFTKFKDAINKWAADTGKGAGDIMGRYIAAAVAENPMVPGPHGWQPAPSIRPKHTAPGQRGPVASPRATPRAVTASAVSVTTARAASTSSVMAHAASTLGLRQIEELWIRAGGDPARAEMMARIALRESSGDPTATNFKGRDHSVGLWQINQLAWHGQFGSDRTLMNPLANARAAVGVYRAQGPRAWSTYNAATDAKYIGGAARAAKPRIKRGTSLMAAGIIAKKFGLRVSSGYRSPEHNAAVGGVPNSYHTRGTASNPGAVDLVGSTAAMSRALAWAKTHVSPLAEAMIHNVGSGLHLHLAFSSSSVTVRVDAGDAGSTAFAAAASPPTQAEINQSHFQRVSNALETIGLREDAGQLAPSEAASAKLGVIKQALGGAFGSLSGHDRLSLLGTRRQTRQERNQALGAIRKKQIDRGKAARHSAYNYYVRNRDLLTEKANAGELTAEQLTMWLRALANNALERKGRFALFFPMTAHEQRLVRADLRELDGDATSFTGTPFDDAALTMAQVDTPGNTADDLAVLQGRLGIARAGYTAAVASGDKAGIVQWGEVLQGLTSSIESLQSSVDQNTSALLELQKTQTQQFQQLFNVSQAQYRVMIRGLTDAFSGEIGGRVGLGFMTPATAGSAASY